MNIPVNPQAPVYHHEEILIQAPLEEVWTILTHIDEWPEWQAAVSEAHLVGKLGEGAEFRWKAGGLRFLSKIHTHSPYRSFGWTGKTLGASAIHNWRFSEQDNQTRVQVEESLDGFFPRLFKKSFQKSLEKGMRTQLRELKQDAENK